MTTAVHVWRLDRVVDGLQRCQLCALHRAPQAGGYAYFMLLQPQLDGDPGCSAAPWVVNQDVSWFEWLLVSERDFLRRYSATLGGLVFVVIDEQASNTWSIGVGGGAFYFEDAAPAVMFEGLLTLGGAQARGMEGARALLQKAHLR